ncbi:MAG: hypothetical protein BroJett033_9110 [Chloroflexota bacterium]|nr:MAG: hypothetical protein BroJett033_9110 [Chloroflexota bacterium]
MRKVLQPDVIILIIITAAIVIVALNQTVTVDIFNAEPVPAAEAPAADATSEAAPAENAATAEATAEAGS